MEEKIINDELALETINEYNSDIKRTTDKCYEAIRWFEGAVRFQIIAELIHRFKIDKDRNV